MGDHTDETLLDDDVEEHDFNFDNEKEDALLADTEFDNLIDESSAPKHTSIPEDVLTELNTEDQLDQEDDVLDIGIAEEDIVEPDIINKPAIHEPIVLEEKTDDLELQESAEPEIIEEVYEHVEEIKSGESVEELVEDESLGEPRVSSLVNTVAQEFESVENIDEKCVKSTVISLRKSDRKSYDDLPDLAKVIELVQPGPTRNRKHGRAVPQKKKRNEIVKKKYEEYDDENDMEMERNFVYENYDYEDDDGYGYMSDVGENEVPRFDNQVYYQPENDFMQPIQRTVDYPYETINNTVRISRQQNFHNVISEFKSFTPHQFSPSDIHVERPILATVQITQERYQIAGDFSIIRPLAPNSINRIPENNFPPNHSFMRPPPSRFPPQQHQFPPNNGPPPPRLIAPPGPQFRDFNPNVRPPLPNNAEQFQIRQRFPPHQARPPMPPRPPHLPPRHFSRPPPPQLPPQSHPNQPPMFAPQQEPFMAQNRVPGPRPMMRQFESPQRPFIQVPSAPFPRPRAPPQPMQRMEMGQSRPMQMPPPQRICMPNVRIPPPQPRMEIRPQRPMLEYYGPPVSAPNLAFNANQPPPPGVPGVQGVHNNHQMPVVPYVDESRVQHPDNEVEYSQYVRTDYYTGRLHDSGEQYTQINNVNYSVNNEVITNNQQQFSQLKRSSSMDSSSNNTLNKQMRYDYSSRKREEDDDMKTYVKKVEDQKKQREKFIQMKEEQRLKNQMQNFIQNNIKGILQKREQFLRENELKKKEYHGDEVEQKIPSINDSISKNVATKSPAKYVPNKNSNNIELSSNNRPHEANVKRISLNQKSSENEDSTVHSEINSSTKQLHKVVKIKYKDGTVALKSFPVSSASTANPMSTKLEGNSLNVTIHDESSSNANRRRMVVSKKIPAANVENDLALQNEKIIVESVRKGVTQSSVPLAQRFSNLKTNVKDEEDCDSSVRIESKNRLVIPDEDESRAVWVKNIGSNTKIALIQKMALTCGTVARINWIQGGQSNQAKITFSKLEEAKKFCSNYNRRMVDLSLILVSMASENR